MNTSSTNKKQGFFYGWIILVACMLIQAIPFGISANVQPQFIDFVTKGEGFTLTQFSLVFTIGTLASAVASPFIGALFSKPKANAKLIYLIGAIMSGGGFLFFAFAKNIWNYYALSAFVQIGTAMISAIGVPMLVNSWFKQNTGLAMGIAFSGGGLGNIFLQQIAAKLLTNPEIGYRGAYFIFGVISMAVAIPVALLLVRLPKSEAELENYRPKKKKNTEDQSAKVVSNWGYTFKEVTKMKSFWLFAVGFIFVGLYVGGMSLQFMGYFYSIGLNAQFVANVGSIFAFVSIFGNLGGGILFDKLGIKNALLTAGLVVVGCGLCLIFTPQFNFLGYVFAAGLGFCMFAYIIGPSYLTGALFGDKEYGTILGIVQVFFAAGFAIGSSLFGAVVDISGGNYTPAWIMVTIFAFLAYALLLFSTEKIMAMKSATTLSK